MVEVLRRRLHDLANVMLVMHGNAELAEFSLEEGDKAGTLQRLAALRASARQAQDLLNAIRDEWNVSGKPAQAIGTPTRGHGFSDTNGLRVLVVDDNPDVLTSITRYLEATGFDVLQASDANEAFKILVRHAETIDVLLSDIRMPGMSGIELAQSARRRYPALGIILMSGYCESLRDIENERLLFLRKPFSWQGLVQALGAVAGESRTVTRPTMMS
jgi:CheY-like chemotaxis protein